MIERTEGVQGMANREKTAEASKHLLCINSISVKMVKLPVENL